MPHPILNRRVSGSSYPNIAAQFTSASSQYATIADNASLSMADIDFSVACWAWLDTRASTQSLMAKGSFDGACEYGLAYSAGSSAFLIYVTNSGAVASVTRTAATFGNPAPGQWNLVVAWHDSVNDLVGISVNDGPADTSAYASGSFDSASPFRLGTDSGLTRFMNGRLDSVGVWKKTLSATERTQLYKAGVGMAYRDLDGGLKTNLVSWFNQDGDFNDSHGINHLTNTNGATFAAGKR